MTSAGSVTHWIEQLKAGDQDAAQKLWERYFLRLVGLARKRLQEMPRRAADEEDVALSAFATFCRRAERGQFAQLNDRDGLWRLLVVITARKATRLVSDERRQKRGGQATARVAIGLEDLISREPTPDFAVQVAEEFERLLGLLGEPALRSLAVLKLEGYTTNEIAAKASCVPRTIERRLRLIRRIWENEFSSTSSEG